MPQVSAREFEELPLRVHAFPADVPCNDVWAVDLPPPPSGITLDEFRRLARARVFRPSPVVRALLGLRMLVGRLLGWDLADTFDVVVQGFPLLPEMIEQVAHAA